MQTENTLPFDGCLYGINPTVSATLGAVPASVREKTSEIRLRAGRPVALTAGGQVLFVRRDSSVCLTPESGCLIATATDLEESYRRTVRGSVYAHAGEIGNGFVIMRGGHRAGLCGSASPSGGLVGITSICYRVAREVKDCARPLVSFFDGGGFLLAGPPGSGKTTLLRDFIRLLSDGADGTYRRIAVVDTRGELSAMAQGKLCLDIGTNTDVLCGFSKERGIEIAVRTLSPDLVAFDEIGSEKEVSRLRQSFYCGVSVLCTAHIGEAEELFSRPVTRELLLSGIITKTAVLHAAGEPPAVYSTDELKKRCGR